MLVPLLLCTLSIYRFFVRWAFLEERLATCPWPTHTHGKLALVPGETETTSEYFNSLLFLKWSQAVASTVVAGAYLVVITGRGRGAVGAKEGRAESVWQRLGPAALLSSDAQRIEKHRAPAAITNGHASSTRPRISPLLLRYTLLSLLQSTSSQLGLHSLSHSISYPT